MIFVLLGSEDGFSTKWQHDASGADRAPALYNALFTTIAFILGAITSIVSGFLGACTAVRWMAFAVSLTVRPDVYY